MILVDRGRRFSLASCWLGFYLRSRKILRWIKIGQGIIYRRMSLAVRSPLRLHGRYWILPNIHRSSRLLINRPSGPFSSHIHWIREYLCRMNLPEYPIPVISGAWNIIMYIAWLGQRALRCFGRKRLPRSRIGALRSKDAWYVSMIPRQTSWPVIPDVPLNFQKSLMRLIE